MLGQRATALERLARDRFDLLVIGAGIIGSRVAYEAAGRGLKVALLDSGDFGGATSSTSSKLIHGGLRYLGMGDYGLVRESLAERFALMSKVAPHLVHPLRFVLPVYRDTPQPPARVGAGILLYAGLAHGRTSPRLLGSRSARRWTPGLRTEGLRFCLSYLDAQTNDSRLVLATVQGADQAGATVLNHVRVIALESSSRGFQAEVRSCLDEGALTVTAASVVNAAGPWVEAVRRLEDPTCSPHSRLSKGVHLLLPPEPGWRAALTVLLDASRVSFVLPWQGMLLLGTTDTEYEGDPADAVVTPEDVCQILSEAQTGVDASVFTKERVAYSFSGLRVLPEGHAETSRAPREHLVSLGRHGMVSVAGGKLTTHRRIAIDVLTRLGDPRLAGLVPTDGPLPGAGFPGLRPPGLDPLLWQHLAGLYGSRAQDVLSYQERFPDALEPIHPGGPDVWAQARFGLEEEAAATVEDICRRRTTLSIRGHATPAVEEALAELVAGRR